MESFRKLGIIEPVLKVIQEHKFSEPSEIQTKSIPLIMEGKDVIAGAATGSGKTLAFAAGIINITENGGGIQSLVLTPTRELAEQISGVLHRFSKNKKLNIVSVYGGVAINPQISKLEKADVVVGTPGRILDHLSRGTLDLDYVKMLVLDEADRMLDMGFQEDVSKIIYKCPKKRQTLLFSATISSDIVYLAGKYMKNPVEVSAESYVDPSKLEQIYYDVEDNKKFSLLVHLLKKEKSELIMVFCNTQRNTDFVANNLKSSGINALAIHGGHSQEKRNRTMERFNSQKINVLVCTDVAARGLDIKGVSHVYNYDSPKDSKDYIHRIGRTARAGKYGKVVNIVASRDYENFGRIMDSKEFNIAKIETPEVERVFIRAREDNYGNRDRSENRNGPRRNNYSKENNREGWDYGNRNKFGNDRQRNRGRENYSRGNDNKGSSDMKARPYSSGNRKFGNRNSGSKDSRRPRNNFGRR
jgi:ATP-dependent RNA helicase DeaD